MVETLGIIIDRHSKGRPRKMKNQTIEKIGCVVPILIGHGDCLLDYDECGIQMPGQPTFEDIKKILGVETF